MPKDSKADQKAKVSANEARRRKEVALAKKHEMDLAERQKLLIPVAQVKEAWVRVLASVKAAVLQIPNRVAPQVLAAGDIKTARDIVRRECELALKEVHDELQASAQ